MAARRRVVLSIWSLALCLLSLAIGPIEATESVPRAADRIRDEPESVWVEFIELARRYKPLNLGQGFPDFAAPAYLVESLHNATRLVDNGVQTNVLNHQYTRSFGHPRLVRALRDYYQNWRNFSQLTDPNGQVLVTVGAYEALFTSIMAFVGPGDEVLIIEPAFDAYAPMVAMAGGTSVFVPLRLLNQTNTGANFTSTWQFGIDMDELESKISNRTRALVLNTPNNPLGKVFRLAELQQIARLCVAHNLLVIADEVYDQFYYAPEDKHISIATLAGMWDRTITIGSAGKTFSVTGWKIGWAVGARHLVRYLQLVHQTAVYTVATPLQEAVARAFEHEMSRPVADGHRYWGELRDELRQKRALMLAILVRARMKPILPQGGYFLMADFGKLATLFPEYLSSSTTTNGTAGGAELQTSASAPQTNDYKFARWLSRVKHIQGIPGSAFYSAAHKSLGANWIRLCFIKSNATLSELDQLVDQMKIAQ